MYDLIIETEVYILQNEPQQEEERRRKRDLHLDAWCQSPSNDGAE